MTEESKIQVSGVVDKYHKDYLKDKINQQFILSTGETVDTVVAWAFASLVKKWIDWNLEKSDDSFLKVLQTIGNVYWRTEKEKKVVHTLDMPKLTSENINNM